MHYMIIKREDGRFFLFNGEWPINIVPQAAPFTEAPVDESLRTTETFIPGLKKALHSEKRTFSIKNIKFEVIERGKLPTS